MQWQFQKPPGTSVYYGGRCRWLCMGNVILHADHLKKMADHLTDGWVHRSKNHPKFVAGGPDWATWKGIVFFRNPSRKVRIVC